MKFLIASTATALVLASPVGWAASGTDTLGASSSGAGDASQKPDHAMINVIPAKQIVGRDLKDAQGIDAGKINSLVIDTKSGAVEFVMITPPSSLNADNRLIAAPWAARRCIDAIVDDHATTARQHDRHPSIRLRLHHLPPAARGFSLHGYLGPDGTRTE